MIELYLVSKSRPDQNKLVGRVNVDLAKVITKAVDLTKIQTRSMNIDIKTETPDDPVYIKGNLNLLVHGLRNIVQDSIEALLIQIEAVPNYKGVIKISLQTEGPRSFITIEDNSKKSSE